ncbi:MAG: abortive infection family protein [Bacilli bacterium]|nr:abortive infection family protein [Bacilli bacterium]
MSDLDKIEYLKYAMQAVAANDQFPTEDYEKYRNEIINNPVYKPYLPRDLATCRNLGEFWTKIKSKFSHYQERRLYLKEEFENLVMFAESNNHLMADDNLTSGIASYGRDYIISAWNKALERRSSDPKGAITVSRTLLETVCKYILDDLSIEYDDKSDMPVLYGLVANNLHLAPNQQTEQIMKQITGGCFSVVQGIGSIRNKISDAHGEGEEQTLVDNKYSMFIVNLAGSLSLFLLDSYESSRAGEQNE